MREQKFINRGRGKLTRWRNEGYGEQSFASILPTNFSPKPLASQWKYPYPFNFSFLLFLFSKSNNIFLPKICLCIGGSLKHELIKVIFLIDIEMYLDRWVAMNMINFFTYQFFYLSINNLFIFWKFSNISYFCFTCN